MLIDAVLIWVYIHEAPGYLTEEAVNTEASRNKTFCEVKLHARFDEHENSKLATEIYKRLQPFYSRYCAHICKEEISGGNVDGKERKRENQTSAGKRFTKNFQLDDPRSNTPGVRCFALPSVRRLCLSLRLLHTVPRQKPPPIAANVTAITSTTSSATAATAAG